MTRWTCEIPPICFFLHQKKSALKKGLLGNYLSTSAHHISHFICIEMKMGLSQSIVINPECTQRENILMLSIEKEKRQLFNQHTAQQLNSS